MNRGFIELHEVVEDAIGDRFVESAFVAVRPDVELQRLQLDARGIGNVLEVAASRNPVDLSSDRDR